MTSNAAFRLFVCETEWSGCADVGITMDFAIKKTG